MCNPEYWVLQSRNQVFECRNPLKNESGIHLLKSVSGIHRGRIYNPAPGIRNPQRGIQNSILWWLTLHWATITIDALLITIKIHDEWLFCNPTRLIQSQVSDLNILIHRIPGSKGLPLPVHKRSFPHRAHVPGVWKTPLQNRLRVASIVTSSCCRVFFRPSPVTSPKPTFNLRYPRIKDHKQVVPTGCLTARRTGQV